METKQRRTKEDEVKGTREQGRRKGKEIKRGKDRTEKEREGRE